MLRHKIKITKHTTITSWTKRWLAKKNGWRRPPQATQKEQVRGWLVRSTCVHGRAWIYTNRPAAAGWGQRWTPEGVELILVLSVAQKPSKLPRSNHEKGHKELPKENRNGGDEVKVGQGNWARGRWGKMRETRGVLAPPASEDRSC